MAAVSVPSGGRGGAVVGGGGGSGGGGGRGRRGVTPIRVGDGNERGPLSAPACGVPASQVVLVGSRNGSSPDAVGGGVRQSSTTVITGDQHRRASVRVWRDRGGEVGDRRNSFSGTGVVREWVGRRMPSSPLQFNDGGGDYFSMRGETEQQEVGEEEEEGEVGDEEDELCCLCIVVVAGVEVGTDHIPKVTRRRRILSDQTRCRATGLPLPLVEEAEDQADRHRHHITIITIKEVEVVEEEEEEIITRPFSNLLDTNLHPHHNHPTTSPPHPSNPVTGDAGRPSRRLPSRLPHRQVGASMLPLPLGGDTLPCLPYPM
ncbi:hypothetical protein HDU67_003035 [Dinochytrium kinnereticum]|nr:hypothetical protein HDU67_003035 [Dinochytrium kinnereticum]